MLTCLLNNKIINCFDGIYNKDQLKTWFKKGILKCPVCKKEYEYCHGKIKIPYFRHKEKNMCEEKYVESETQEHLKGKYDLYKWVKKLPGVSDVTLEGWISETKQRPDIMFKYNNEQYVIEYQCTPITSEYFERHDLYSAAGIKDIWILGAKRYFQEYYPGHKKGNIKRFNTIEKNDNPIYYDSDLEMLMIINHKLDIKKVPNKKFIYYKKHRYDNRKNNFMRIKSIKVDYRWYSHHTRKGWWEEYVYIGNFSTACCKKIKDIHSLDYLFNVDLWINK